MKRRLHFPTWQHWAIQSKHYNLLYRQWNPITHADNWWWAHETPATLLRESKLGDSCVGQRALLSGEQISWWLETDSSKQWTAQDVINGGTVATFICRWHHLLTEPAAFICVMSSVDGPSLSTAYWANHMSNLRHTASEWPTEQLDWPILADKLPVYSSQ